VGKSRFQEHWLQRPEFADWLRRDSKDVDLISSAQKEFWIKVLETLWLSFSSSSESKALHQMRGTFCYSPDLCLILLHQFSRVLDGLVHMMMLMS